MPIFEYRCTDCRSEFEALVRSSGEPACPQCGSQSLDKLLSVFATAQASSQPAFVGGPCGACGHPDGPGACRFE